MKLGDACANIGALFRKAFPERQIYVRSAGNVQFFTFGPSLQATLAVFCLLFLGWASFTTVVVIFKDRSIAALDYHYDEMRAAYEDRIAGLSASHDALAAAFTRSRQQFAGATEELVNKQSAITGLFAGESRLEGISGTSDADTAVPLRGADDGVAPALTLSSEASSKLEYSDRDSGRTQPDASVTAFQSAISLARRLAASLFVRSRSLPPEDAEPQNPRLRALGRQMERVRLLNGQETRLVEDTGRLFDQRVGNLHQIIRRTGINPVQFIGKAAATEAMGGPEISLGQVRIAGIADTDFTHAYLRASAVLAQLDLVSGAIGHIPLAMPVSAAHFDRTSGFGPRLDPFTGRYAFHPGLDFGGPWGAPVVATAPGTVVFAGERGSYGVVVEIDHGMGLHTRYAHLSALVVSTGARVNRGTVIARVGSTGRSTGSHVHYEVWYENIVRNPALFIGASGRTRSNPIGLSSEGKPVIGSDQD